jgi:hypothetical protein
MAIKDYKFSHPIEYSRLKLMGDNVPARNDNMVAAYLGVDELEHSTLLEKGKVYTLSQEGRTSLDNMMTVALSFPALNANLGFVKRAVLVLVDMPFLARTISVLDSIVDGKKPLPIKLQEGQKRSLYALQEDDNTVLVIVGMEDWYDHYSTIEKTRKDLCEEGVMIRDKKEYYDILAVCINASPYCKRPPDGKALTEAADFAERCKAPVLISNFLGFQQPRVPAEVKDKPEAPKFVFKGLTTQLKKAPEPVTTPPVDTPKKTDELEQKLAWVPTAEEEFIHEVVESARKYNIPFLVVSTHGVYSYKNTQEDLVCEYLVNSLHNFRDRILTDPRTIAASERAQRPI